MEQQAYDHLLEVEQVAQATVVRFKRRTILEPNSIRAIGHRLLCLAGEEGRRTILVNFSGVESMTSAMLGEFAVLQRVLNDSGGQLAFCCVEPFLMQVFKVVKIPERIVIHADEETALQALSTLAGNSGPARLAGPTESTCREPSGTSGPARLAGPT